MLATKHTKIVSLPLVVSLASLLIASSLWRTPCTGPMQTYRTTLNQGRRAIKCNLKTMRAPPSIKRFSNLAHKSVMTLVSSTNLFTLQVHSNPSSRTTQMSCLDLQEWCASLNKRNSFRSKAENLEVMINCRSWKARRCRLKRGTWLTLNTQVA